MELTDEEKLAMLAVAYEPEEGEYLYLVIDKDSEGKCNIIGIFTDTNKQQADSVSNATGGYVVAVKANIVVEGGIIYES